MCLCECFVLKKKPFCFLIRKLDIIRNIFHTVMMLIHDVDFYQYMVKQFKLYFIKVTDNFTQIVSQVRFPLAAHLTPTCHATHRLTTLLLRDFNCNPLIRSVSQISIDINCMGARVRVQSTCALTWMLHSYIVQSNPVFCACPNQPE